MKVRVVDEAVRSSLRWLDKHAQEWKNEKTFILQSRWNNCAIM